MDQVVKLTVFLTDLADLPAFRHSAGRVEGRATAPANLATDSGTAVRFACALGALASVWAGMVSRVAQVDPADIGGRRWTCAFSLPGCAGPRCG
jgi:hypothetical protein